MAGTMNKISTKMAETESFRSENKFIFKWTIHGFDCEKVTDGEELPSTKFSFKLQSGIHFQAELSLTGEDCASRDFMFKLKSSTHDNWIVSCSFLLNMKKEYEGILKNNDNKHSIFSLIDDDYDPEICCLVKDTNTISCEILHVSYIEKSKPSLPEIKESQLHHDLEVLFRRKKLWDVVFEVEGHEMYAHKCILSSRSKVFADMFERPTKRVKSIEQSNGEAAVDPNESNLSLCPLEIETEEDQSNKVIVEDIEPEIFEEILRFAYTERVQNLEKMPSRLLVASTKYGLDRLKSLCEHELARKISIESSAETLILADLHGSPELKKLSIDFIKKHSKAILITKGWQKIVKDHINLLTELYIEIVQ